MYNIEIYETKNEKSEIKEYIKKLQQNNSKEKQIKFKKIIAYIRMLQEQGLTLGEPYIKHIEKDIWELRPLRNRILFAYCRNNTFVLLTIFMKKTQKTPKREIERAKRYLEDYKRRSGVRWIGNLKNGITLKRA